MSEGTHYEYRFEDRSILLRLLKEPVFMRIARALPLQVTPNAVTIVGHLFVWASLAVALLTPTGDPGTLVFVAFGLALYVVADCVDGMFARHTQRASPLGELLDHGLDGISLPLVAVIFGITLQQPAWVLLSATGAVTFIFVLTFLHGYRVGHVVLGEVGIIECILIGSVLLLVGASIGMEPLVRPVALGLSLSGLLMLGMIAGSIVALLEMAAAVARWHRDLVTFATLMATIVAWIVLGDLPVVPAALLFVAVGACQACLITTARLRRLPLTLRDPLLVGLLALSAAASILLGLDQPTQATAAIVVIAYALARGGRAFGAAFVEIRDAAAVRRTAVSL